MKEVKHYECDFTPTDDEIREGMKIASDAHCIVKLNWRFPYSGSYYLIIKEGMTFDQCKARLPEFYPI